MSGEDGYTFDRVIFSQEALRDQMVIAFTHARSVIQNGKSVRVLIEEALEPIRIKQRNFLHGVVLAQISEQVKVPQFDSHGAPTGKVERYVIDTWKEHFRERFLGWKHVMKRGFVLDKKTGLWRPAKKKTPHREAISSETLGVKRYAEWTDKIIDHAIEEMGVVFVFKFEEREEVRWRAKPKSTTGAAT